MLVGLGIQDYAYGGCVIHDFPVGAVFKIVSSVMASIAVDVLKNEVSIWGVGLAFNRIKDMLFFKKNLKKKLFYLSEAYSQRA